MSIEIRRATCYWCHSHCRVEAHVRDGRLEKIEEDKADPRSKRFRPVVRACPRARAAAEYFYHQDRLAYPMKRIGEKGERKWQQIPWEQALDEIATKLGQIREEHGAEAVATSSGTFRTNDEYRLRFMNLFGSPNHISQAMVCYGMGIIGLALLGYWNEFAGMGISLSKTNCLIIWGGNPEQSNRRLWLSLLNRTKEGMKLIFIDPRRVGGTDRADLWLQLRPGTDVALSMGMINVIITEGLYDKKFVEKWCHGFDRLAERARDYPLEKVAQITWVPQEKIAEAARLYATNRPAAIYHSMGVEHLSNGAEAYHARTILAAITGNLDVRGGDLLVGWLPELRNLYGMEMNDALPPEQRIKQIGTERFRLQGLIGYDLIKNYAKTMWSRGVVGLAHAPSLYRAIITQEPYPVKALITLSSNPMVTQANTKLVYNALKNLELYVVVDYWMTPSAELADYVLPAACWLERPQYFAADGVTAADAVMPSQVEGKCDRRADYEFWRGLGIRLGQQKHWPWENPEQVFDHELEPTGYKFRDFVDKVGGFLLPSNEDRKYEKLGFGTPTGKVELYSTILEKLGYDPLPRYYEPAESPVSTPDLAKEYPLILITGSRHQPFYHSEHRQIDSLRKQHPEPIVQIHPQTALELGIENGDWVWIETPRGRARQRCQYFDGIDPRVVHAQHGWWFPELPGEEPWLHGVWESNINVVTDDDPEHCNQISGGWPLRGELCRVYKLKKYLSK